MQHGSPDFWQNLRTEIAGGRRWADRTVVLGYAVLTGLVVVGFTHLAERASAWQAQLAGLALWGPPLMLVWTPLWTGMIVAWTRRYAPGALGSGVPHVVLALSADDDAAPPPPQLVSLRLALQKVLLVSAGLLAGLSIGREGPTVQVGAGVMQHARRWLSARSGVDAHDLMVAGAAAGIAAAFNTPLGGVIFALEQLSMRHASRHGGLVVMAIVLSGLVAVSIDGNLSYFGALSVQTLSWSLLGPGLLVALASGLLGGLFSRLIVVSARNGFGRLGLWRREHPVRFAMACGLAVAALGWISGGNVAGAGYAPTRAMLEAQSDVSLLYTPLKFVATWLSAWSGAPAGVFSPSLAIGAGIGRDVAALTAVGPDAAIPLIALGMAGFLAATTQGPLTAFIIVMEMVAGHAMVLSLMATALLASGVARLVARPMYGELAATLAAAVPPTPSNRNARATFPG